MPSGAITVISIIIAVVIAIVRVILSTMEDRDRAGGVPTNHDEYTMSGLLKLMLKERRMAFREWRQNRKRKRKRHSKKIGKENKRE